MEREFGPVHFFPGIAGIFGSVDYQDGKKETCFHWTPLRSVLIFHQKQVLSETGARIGG